MFDLLIKNAYVFDGTGAEGFHSDIGIVSGKIAAMAQTINAQAKSIINASGLTLTPGFIDAHSHQDIIVEEYPECICAVEQGITTQIAGMCGDSAAPISPEHTADALRIISSLKGGALPSPVENRFSFGGYLEQIDKPIGTNMAFLVGHGMIRAAVMGFENRRPTAHEMEQMKAIVQQAMDGGAFGISFGLIYPPGSYCNADEMSELCKVVAQNGGVMTVHVRSESNGLIEAVEEMLGVVRSSGVRCVISHHKATGGSANWGKTAKTLDLIQKINAEGYDVFTDQYPYTASATGLATNIPDGMFTLGTDKLIAMLSSRDGREQLRPFILGKSSPKERFKYTMIGSSPSHPEYNGKMLNNIADELNIDPYELQCDILRDDRLLTGGIYHTMSEDDLKRVMQYRHTMIGTDGMWYPGCGGCHPRSIGTFPRVLGRYVREKQYISLSEAVRRMTSLPAQVYGLKSKGLIVNGYDADIVLFDAAKIIDHADYGSPYARCEGLEYVIVGGKIAAQNAVFTGIKAGRIIKSRRAFTSQSSNL